MRKLEKTVECAVASTENKLKVVRMALSQEINIKIIEYWYEANSVVGVKRKLRTDYRLGRDKVPGRSTLRKLIRKFKNHGELSSVKAGRSGRKILYKMTGALLIL